MAWLIIFGALAAWGLLCAFWAMFGWLLPGSGRAGLILIYPRSQPEELILRYRWLRSLGLIQGPLVLVCAPEEQADLERRYADMEFCSLEDASARLEAERAN